MARKARARRYFSRQPELDKTLEALSLRFVSGRHTEEAIQA